ncbi:MAG: nucleotide-binding protein [Candidatus Woesearchaeota archaeon]|nr:nucleotide-binding protein [Candidatus Woesearchaeota archaeon]
MKAIILDTNFLTIPAEFKVDIFSEIDRICNFNYSLFVLDKSVEELKKMIETQKGKEKAKARLALQLIENKEISIIKTNSGKTVDDLLVDLSEDRNNIIATQDRELRKQLKGKTTIFLRNKKYLEMSTG